jgi:hypothetical protein
MRLVWLSLVPLFAHADTSIQSKATDKNICIVKAEDGAKYYYSQTKTEFWTPTSSDVARLEAKLEPFLKAEHARQKNHGPGPLPSYLRQYVGILGKGRYVSVYAWIPFDAKDDPCQVHGIKDGGCGVWRVTFDVKTGKLLDFACNGEA